MTHTLPGILFALALGTGAATAAPQPGTSSSKSEEWRAQQRAAVEKSENLLGQAEKQKGLLAQYTLLRGAYNADESAHFRLIFSQYVSWYESFIGAYDEARTTFSIRQPAADDDAASPFEDASLHAEDAVEAITRLSEGRKAVFFNEAHNAPVTRVLTVQMLEKLRKQGFNTFAAETLYPGDTTLGERGYPIADSGFYTREPIYAEMVRTALKLGYRVVSYESESQKGGNEREREQAQNLYNASFKQDPKTRLVVNAGYAHIQESGKYLGGESMAQHFARIARIDPLTIEQTMLIEHDTASKDHPYFRTYAASSRRSVATVFMTSKNKAWTLKPDLYDVSVFLPVTDHERDRPTWLALGGLRTSYQVGAELCRGQLPCLLEARYIEEDSDAVPADRLVVSRLQQVSHLYLRPGRYRLSSSNLDNETIASVNITVTADGKNP
ncbi:hypothetical protein [Tahibacter amnicola]|uniref:Lipoprotein n=1 Tax=Tahibacter amnicola TaxID=2976241 RepID=A0ABY6BAU9_9GAMM|nr:hypothetical protein [Tahibacter amnicola]UXI66989.1 hypothetical protein N4264_19875 [Tahibacter amnicola]